MRGVMAWRELGAGRWALGAGRWALTLEGVFFWR